MIWSTTSRKTESGSSPWSESVDVDGVKTPGALESALSAPPEFRASTSLSRTPGKVGPCDLAGPSPSSSERSELCPRPRPLPGCSQTAVQGFSSGPASPPGGRPAAARGPLSPGSASAPGAR